MSGYEQDGLPIIGPYKQLVKKGTRIPARELLTKIVKFEPMQLCCMHYHYKQICDFRSVLKVCNMFK